MVPSRDFPMGLPVLDAQARISGRHCPQRRAPNEPTSRSKFHRVERAGARTPPGPHPHDQRATASLARRGYVTGYRCPVEADRYSISCGRCVPVPVRNAVAERHAVRGWLHVRADASACHQVRRCVQPRDQRAINATWASKVWFKWYSVTTAPGARTPQDSARRDKLLPYFAERHAASERLRITRLKINGVSGGAYRNFEFQLMRSADNLTGGPVAYIGKGASTCSTGRLFVWVMNAAP